MNLYSTRDIKLSPLIYLVIPFALALSLAYFAFEASDDFSAHLWTLAAPVIVIAIYEIWSIWQNRSLPRARLTLASLDQKNFSRVVIVVFGWVVLLSCLLDLYVHSIVILNPDPRAYSTFTPFQAHLRHISLMCWTLAPISFLKRIGLKNRIPFLLTALAFPILVLDRNRILETFGALAMTFFLFPELSKGPIRNWAKIFCTVLIGAYLFSALGAKRTTDSNLNRMLVHGTSQELEKYPGMDEYFKELQVRCPRTHELPLQPWFLRRSTKAQWILTYITSPIFNFHTIVRCNWHDSDYLKAQVLPLWKKLYGEPPPLPLVSPYLNVGTEFMPFFLAGGWPMTFLGFALLGLSLLVSARRFEATSDFFLYLVFLRLSYCAFTASFAPQFFTWTTFGFVILCFGARLACKGEALIDKTVLKKWLTRRYTAMDFNVTDGSNKQARFND